MEKKIFISLIILLSLGLSIFINKFHFYISEKIDPQNLAILLSCISIPLGYFASYGWIINKYYKFNYTNSDINWNNFLIYLIRFTLMFIVIFFILFFIKQILNIIVFMILLGLSFLVLSQRNIHLVFKILYVSIIAFFLFYYFLDINLNNLINNLLKILVIPMIIGVIIFLIKNRVHFAIILLVLLISVYLIYRSRIFIGVQNIHSKRIDPSLGSDPSTIIEILPDTSK